jgi:hypothetical protein
MSLFQETERIKHDPRTKQQIKDALYERLYSPIEHRFQQRLREIIVSNTLASRSGHMSFSYKGVYYNVDKNPPPRIANRLHPSMQAEMDTYLKELNELNQKEIPYVVGYINRVLNSSNHLCDYYRLLPDSLHPPLAKLIGTCPCQGNGLTEEQVAAIQKANNESLELLKQRMVINLLI